MHHLVTNANDFAFVTLISHTTEETSFRTGLLAASGLIRALVNLYRTLSVEAFRILRMVCRKTWKARGKMSCWLWLTKTGIKYCSCHKNCKHNRVWRQEYLFKKLSPLQIERETLEKQSLTWGHLMLVPSAFWLLSFFEHGFPIHSTTIEFVRAALSCSPGNPPRLFRRVSSKHPFNHELYGQTMSNGYIIFYFTNHRKRRKTWGE